MQNFFLKFISFKFNIHSSPHDPYENVLNFLILTPFKDSRLLFLSACLYLVLLAIPKFHL